MDRLEPRMLLAAQLSISEFMAANRTVLADEDGNYSDWIEIHNSGSSTARLKGYFLTDDPNDLTKWAFPDVLLGPDEYLVVFASGRNRAVPGRELHTNFGLGVSGEYLALVAPDGRTVVSAFEPEYPSQEPDISYGIDASSPGWPLRFFATPSPGRANARAEVVINEIHYAPDVKTELVEFIELYNPGSAAVDLSGAQFTAGIEYTFPEGTILGPGAYLVVAMNPAHFQAKFGRTALGPWTGILANEGETITLCNRSGGQLDEVDYKLGFPWPTVGDSPGYSIELIHPDLDNSKGGNWRSFAPSGPATEVTLFASGGTWRYRKGTSEASSPKGAWRELNFTEDGTWVTGTGPIGYDGGVAFPGSPDLADMKSSYTCVFMRKTFTVADPAVFSSWWLEAMYDDGFNAWINGTRVAWSQVADENLNFDAVASSPARESNAYDRFNITSSPAAVLKPGLNVIAVQFFNINKGSSSDAFFDARLIASTGGGGVSPTPGRKNSVYALNAPPVVRQVKHSPEQPVSGQPVKISARVTDPHGVSTVSLSYQLVNPGSYFSKEDAAYNSPANWTTVTMKDDGTGGDATAGDGIYTVVLPGSLQTHRRLVRYRIMAGDALGASVTVPYADDPQPNFAYFVYDGIPTWSGAIQPGSSDPAKNQVVTYDFGAMPSIPVYHLITTRKAHEESQYIPNSTAGQYWGDSYPWAGTLVYDGIVYDHIHFRARGGVWRYSMGKNMWKFDFNRGHEFQARDEYGRRLKTTWKKLNLGANIQQGNFGQRGEQGLFEYVGFKLFNLAGTPSSIAFPVHFRIIENASETNGTPGNQYDDDFQGLYLAIEQMDGRFLDEHGLEDGNLYKMESGVGGGESNNQGPTQPSDNSDLVAFSNTIKNTTPTEQWWRNNVNLEWYYGYRSIVEAIHHWDIGFGKNYFYYHDPVTGKWSQHPWDLDLTWTTTYEPSGGDAEPFKKLLSISALQLEYKNRLREIRDLLFNTDQVGQMLDEYAGMVDMPNPGASMVGADRAMWDYNPILRSSYVNLDKADWGRFYQSATPKTFRGFVQKLKNYVASRGVYLDNLASDSLIPAKPTVTYIGPAGYPVDQLRFRSSQFVDSTGTFAAMKWRIAEVTAPGQPAYDPDNPRKYEIIASWESPEITIFNSEITIPGVVEKDGRFVPVVEAGKTYRVRVRMKDSTGRWSNWSNPVEFTAGPGGSAVRDALRITEIHYNPADPPQGSPYGNDDFEFIELTNISPLTVNLQDVRFSAGITFTFVGVDLLPGQHVLVVKNYEAFASRYRTASMLIAGVYTGSLSNGGERIALLDAAGQTILDFTYLDTWQPSTDGGGRSLVVADVYAPADAWNDQQQWRASRIPGGTPGAAETTLPDGSIVINEALTHTDEPSGDWVELYNTTDNAIDLSGWWLSDDEADPWKYQIQPGTVIEAHGFLVLTQAEHFGNPQAPGVVSAFGFSELGDEVIVSSAVGGGILTGYQACQKLEAVDKEVTLGRYLKSTGQADFIPLVAATCGGGNARPCVGPIVLNEIMYNPLGDADEFIELRNITDRAIPLYDPAFPQNRWRLIDGVAYEFPELLTLLPGEYVLVVGIDPTVFRSRYQIPEQVRVFGPYAGSLDDAGELLALACPGLPEPGGYVPYYIVDRVRYDDMSPWPVEPAGTGPALGRRIAAEYGNDPANWAATAEGGTPGYANFDPTPPQADILDVSPDPRQNAVDSISIVFSEPVTGFDLSDLVLRRNGIPVPLTDCQTLTSADGVTWVLANLRPLTFLQASYELTLRAEGSGIIDSAGNALAQDAYEAFEVTRTIIQGGVGNETIHVRRAGAIIEVFVDAGPADPPTCTLPADWVTELVIDGSAGDDSLWLDFSGGQPCPALGLSFHGGQDQGDVLILTGTGSQEARLCPDSDAGNGYLSVGGVRYQFSGTESLTVSGFLSFDFVTPREQDVLWIERLSSGANRVYGSSAGQPLIPVTFSNNGLLSIDVASNDALDGSYDKITLIGSLAGDVELSLGDGPGVIGFLAGTHELPLKLRLSGSDLRVEAAGTSLVRLAGTCLFSSVAIKDSARMELIADGQTVLRTGALLIEADGVLDLDQGPLIIDATSATREAVLADVSTWIRKARNTVPRKWQGTGITYRSAMDNPLRGLAVAINDRGQGLPILSSLAGQAVGINSVLVRPTWNGDMTLDGRINADDYFLIDSGFLAQGRGYRCGDLNFDGSVNADDYFLIDSAFLGQSGILAAGMGASPIWPSVSGSVESTTEDEDGELFLVDRPAVWLKGERRRSFAESGWSGEEPVAVW